MLTMSSITPCRCQNLFATLASASQCQLHALWMYDARALMSIINQVHRPLDIGIAEAKSVCSAHLHAVEADEVVQLVVLDDGQEKEEENNKGHKLATVIQRRQGSCMLCCLSCMQYAVYSQVGNTEASSGTKLPGI